MPKPFGPTMILAILCAWISGAASAFETKAQAAYVLDHDSGTVLLAKQAEVALPPASMSKLMTLFLTFEALRDGRLRWDERLPVSAHAMSYGGSTMFWTPRTGSPSRISFAALSFYPAMTPALSLLKPCLWMAPKLALLR